MYDCFRDAQVQLASEDGAMATVMGLDEHGYLQVCLNDKPGEILTVQADGNSFDMMRNMIIPKKQK